MKTAHAPGPWRLDGKVIKSNNGQNIGGCVVSRMTGPDARLIAAAPALLGALEMILNDYDDTGCDRSGVVSQAMIEHARRVIQNIGGAQ